MRMIFVRHGKDDDSCRGGWSTMGLLAEGREQARAAASYFSDTPDYQIGRILSSDLNRAVETAEYIAAALNVPLYTDAQLREINNGDLAGMRNSEALEKYPGLFFNSLDMDEPYPNGESPAAFYHRIRAWFERTLSEMQNDDRDLLVVTHGGVISIIYSLVEGSEWSNRQPVVPAAYGSIHVLNTAARTFEVKNKTIRT